MYICLKVQSFQSFTSSDSTSLTPCNLADFDISAVESHVLCTNGFHACETREWYCSVQCTVGTAKISTLKRPLCNVRV